MNQEEEISDVVIVLEVKTDAEVDAVVEKLKSMGLSIDGIDYENGVVEGNIAADAVKKLQSVPAVKHVRSVFSYTAEPPAAEDALNTEPEEEEEK